MKIDVRGCTGCTGLHGNVLCNPCNYENIEVFAERAGGCTGCTKGSLCNPSKTLLETRLHGLHGLHPLKGAPRGRATPAPMPLGAPRFPNTPTRALDAIRELVFKFDRHAKAQTEADTPAHGLLNEEPEMIPQPNDPTRIWSEEELLIVRVCWARGESAREITSRLSGRSRSAVIGVVNRRRFKREDASVRNVDLPMAPRRTMMDAGQRRSAMTTYLRDHTAPITLAGPSWSHPASGVAA